jgi:hypothetical protein
MTSLAGNRRKVFTSSQANKNILINYLLNNAPRQLKMVPSNFQYIIHLKFFKIFGYSNGFLKT